MKLNILVAIGLLAISACVAVDERKTDPAAIASVNLSLAKAYFTKAQYSVAEEKLDKALKAEPDNIAANSLLALVYDQQAKTKKAQDQFEKALDLAAQDSVESAEINNNFGIFLCKNDQWPEAEKRFLKALEVNDYKTPYAALENAGLCAFNVRDYEKAESYFQKALAENKQLPRSLLGLSKIKAGKNHWAEVKKLIENFHALFNASDESLYLAIQAEHNLGNESDAERFFDQLNTTFPNSAFIKKLELDQQ